MEIPKYEEYFKQIKTNLRVVGISFGDVKVSFKYYIFIITYSFMVIEETAFIISKVNKVNLLEITQLAPCLGIGLSSLLKFLAVYSKRRKIYDLTDNIEKLYVIIENDSSKKNLVGQNFIYLKMLIKYFFALNAVLISVYNFSSPILMSYSYLTHNQFEFMLPYAVWLPFEVNSWLTWTLVYLHSCYAGFFCVLYFTAVDVLYCVLTTHICANFATISERIKDLNASNVHLLRDIVKDHQYILKLSDDLEDIFTAANLFNVLIGSMEICALGFNLTMGDMKQIPGCILFLASVLIQILMMSVFGENIITESSKIGQMAYICKWYNMDHNSKKIILAIITRALKPKRLTAYKFSVISYGSFSKIISTSWSYFTILRSVYTPTDINYEEINN